MQFCQSLQGYTGLIWPKHGPAEEREHFAPTAHGGGVIVGGKVRQHPTLRGRLDLRRLPHVDLHEGALHPRGHCGRLAAVVLGRCDVDLGHRLWREQVRARQSQDCRRESWRPPRIGQGKFQRKSGPYRLTCGSLPHWPHCSRRNFLKPRVDRPRTTQPGRRSSSPQRPESGPFEGRQRVGTGLSVYGWVGWIADGSSAIRS